MSLTPEEKNAWTHFHLSPPYFLHLANSKIFIFTKWSWEDRSFCKYILQQAGNRIKLRSPQSVLFYCCLCKQTLD